MSIKFKPGDKVKYTGQPTTCLDNNTVYTVSVGSGYFMYVEEIHNGILLKAKDFIKVNGLVAAAGRVDRPEDAARRLADLFIEEMKKPTKDVK